MRKAKLCDSKKSDQARTPEDILERLYRFTNTRPGQWYELCRFFLNWNAIFFANALTMTWPLKYCFLNIPFSQAGPFMDKALLE